MASSSIIRIIDTARIQAPGCLEGTFRLELFNTVKEFLRRSDAWHECVDIPVVPGTVDYDLPTWGSGTITRLIWVEGPRNPATQQDPRPCGPIRHGHLHHPDAQGACLRLRWAPAAVELWYAHVALTCADPTDTDGLPRVPDWVLEAYHDYILSGLLSRVMMHPNKPYSNDRMSMYHGKRFNEGMAIAKKEAANGYRLGGQSWSFPQAYRTTSQRTNRW